MNSIIDKIRDNIIEYSMVSKGDKVVVGLSGGADSVMLFMALLKLREVFDYTLSAAHVNHGIRGESANEDGAFCERLCNSFYVPFHMTHFNIPKISSELKTSEENAGRIKRYEYFNELCKKYGYNKIAVAHNMNDSVETVIINMIRGSSLNGLCGIKPVNANIIRPIFNITREEIEAYLSDNGIDYRIDETNLTDDYTRNKVRNNILETMKEINPSVIKTIFSNSKNLRDDDEYILSQTVKTDCITQEDDKVIIDKEIFDSQHVAIKKRILFDAFQRLKGNTNNIEKKHVEILLGNLLSGKTYNMPDGIFISVSFNQIIFSKGTSSSEYIELEAVPGKKIKFGDKVIELCFSENISFKDPDALYVDFGKIHGDLTIRSRRNGDRFIPYGMSGYKKIKQFISELKIPFYKREEIPILCDEKEIVAVIPYRIGEHYKISENTTKVLKIQMIKEN